MTCSGCDLIGQTASAYAFQNWPNDCRKWLLCGDESLGVDFWFVPQAALCDCPLYWKQSGSKEVDNVQRIQCVVGCYGAYTRRTIGFRPAA